MMKQPDLFENHFSCAGKMVYAPPGKMCGNAWLELGNPWQRPETDCNETTKTTQEPKCTT